MSIERLIKEGSVHSFIGTSEEINRAMDIAKRDLTLAESILNESLDWSYSIAYNAILQACRAYMFRLGYRPATYEAHKATLEFMRIVADEPFEKTIVYFDRVRRKRHRTVYDEVGLITQKEAEQLIKKAKDFLVYIENKLEN